MTVAQRIVAHVQRLPEPLQVEVLDFVEFLVAKLSRDFRKQENQEWMRFSLESALRDMEDEPDLYSAEDLKERFQ